MTPARLLVMGAGTAAAENLIQSLRRAEPALTLVGCHEDRFALKHSTADARYLVPAPGRPDFMHRLSGLVRAAHIDLVIPTADRHVLSLSARRRQLPGKLFLPTDGVVRLCHDKYALAAALRRRGLPAPIAYRVTRLQAVDRIFARFGRPARLWCRPRTGSARGAAARCPAPSRPELDRALGNHARRARLVVTLSEFLPGREILCQSVWRRGRLILATRSSVSLSFGVDNIPSGVRRPHHWP